MRMPLTLIVGFVHMDLNGLSPLAQGWASELGESGDFGHILEGSTSRSHVNCYFGYGHSQGIRGACMWSQVCTIDKSKRARVEMSLFLNCSF